MYTDSTLQPIADNAPYTDSAGIKYPRNFPKGEISDLHLVNETPKPIDDSLIILGFHIDENYNQVWDTRPKTQDELDAELQSQWIYVREKQRSMIETSSASWRCARYQTQLPIGATVDTETTYLAMLNWLQSVRDCDDTNYTTPELAMAALDALPAEPA